MPGDRGIHRIVGTLVGALNPDVGAKCQVEQGDWTEVSGPMGERERLTTLEHTRRLSDGKAGDYLIDRVHGRPVTSIHLANPCLRLGIFASGLLLTNADGPRGALTSYMGCEQHHFHARGASQSSRLASMIASTRATGLVKSAS